MTMTTVTRKFHWLWLVFAMQSSFGQSVGSKESSFAFTGEIGARGMSPARSGKFTILRITFGVMTAEADCGMYAQLSSPEGKALDQGRTVSLKKMSTGKGTLIVDFFGPEIAQLAPDSPLALSRIKMVCHVEDRQLPYEVSDQTEHKLANLRSSNFDNPPSDFHLFSQTAQLRVGTGDVVRSEVLIRTTGVVNDEIRATAEATDPHLHVLMENNPVSCESSLTCWREGAPVFLSIRTDIDTPPGEYEIRIGARTPSLNHSMKLSVVVDPEITRRKREAAATRAAALNKLNSAEPVRPIPSVAPPLKDVTPNFSSGTALRKIHAVLVLDRSGSMEVKDSCTFMKAAARRFADLFVDGRDSLSVISFSSAGETILPMTDHFKRSAPDRISGIRCSGATNTALALEMAQIELDRHPDPEAIHTVVLFTDGYPNMLAANWSMSDPKYCLEARNGRVEGSLMQRSEQLFAIGSSNTGQPESNSCFAYGRAFEGMQYIPETDLHGISLVRPRPLERFSDGPFAGKPRLHKEKNLESAIANQMENAATQLRTSKRHPAFVYVIAFDNGPSEVFAKDLAAFKKLANDPAGSSFQKNEPASSVIVTEGPEEFWPAFQRIRREIIQHAEIPQ